MTFSLPPELLDWRLALSALPALGGLAGYYVPAMLRRQRELRDAPPATDHAETFLSQEMPWAQVLDDGITVRTDRGGLFRVYSLAGLVYSHLGDKAAEQFRTMRQNWFMAQRHNPIDLRFYSFRSRLVLPPPATSSGFLADLDHIWHQHLADVYATEHFAVLSVPSAGQETRLAHVAEALEQDLAPFGAKVVPFKDEHGYSPLTTFLARLAAGAAPPLEAGPADQLKEATALRDAQWSRRGLGYTTDGLVETYWAVISVKDWGERSSTEMVKALLNMPADLTLYMRVRPLSPTSARGLTEYKKKQDNMGADSGAAKNNPGVVQQRLNSFTSQEWKDTIDELAAEKDALGRYEMAVFLRAPTLEQLEELKRAVRGILGGKVNRAVIERGLAQRWYQGTWPGFDYWTRKRQFRASNVADFTPWQAEPQGRHRSDWGLGALRYMPTAGARAPYGLTLHVSEGDQAVAHFGAIAGTGMGKTVALSWIITGAMTAHPNLRAWMFDKDFGLRVLAGAIEDAVYLIPESEDLPLNFLDTENTPGARSNIESMFALLAGVDTENDHEALTRIATATRDIMQLPRQKRVFKDVYADAFHAGKLRNALEMWVKSDRYGRIFNGTKDAFDPHAARLVVIDMTNVLEDPRLSGALTHYFLLRIQSVVRAGKTPHIIFVDETGTMEQDPPFAAALANFLRTKRKDHGAVGVSYQEVATVLNSPIAAVLRSNIKTWFIWPGTATSKDECKAFGLNDWQTRFALGEGEIPPGCQYPVLLKRSDESVLLDFNLSPLGPHLRFFAGGAGPVERMQRCIREFGLDRWKHEYLQWR